MNEEYLNGKGNLAILQEANARNIFANVEGPVDKHDARHIEKGRVYSSSSRINNLNKNSDRKDAAETKKELMNA